MEKNLKKYVYIHIYKLNHFALHLKLTQHCKSTILHFFRKGVLPSMNCIIVRCSASLGVILWDLRLAGT